MASGLLAALEESDEKLQAHALRGLLAVVDEHWAEVSASVARLEAFAEDDAFPQRALASLLCARVFFHLGEQGEALSYALGAGPLFDVNDDSEFVTTMLGTRAATPTAAGV